MKNLLFAAVIFCLVQTPLSRPLAYTVSDQKSQLDARLEIIGNQARSARHWGGGLMLGAGAIFGISAFTMDTDTESRRRASRGLGIAGAVFGSLGTLILLVPNANERLPQRYSAMPESSKEELRRKVQAGEVYLEDLADQARLGRLVGGGFMAAISGLYLIEAAEEDDDDIQQGRWMGAALFGGFALLRFLTKTPQEKLFHRYQNWKKTGTLDESLSFNIGFLPVPSGAGVMLSTRF